MNKTEQNIFNALLKVRKIAAQEGIVIKEVGVHDFLHDKETDITPTRLLGIKIN